MKNVFPIGTGQMKGFMKAQFHQRINRKGPQVFNLVLLTVILLALQQKEISFNFNISGNPTPDNIPSEVPIAKGEFTPIKVAIHSEEHDLSKPETVVQTAKTYIGKGIMTINNPLSQPSPDDLAAKDNLSNTYSNMTYNTGEKPAQLSIPATISDNSERAAYLMKRKKQDAYVARFAAVAQTEMRKYGIPASITLAQGLIESNAGESRLSKENNNHFGMKCFSSKCSKGHCSNFTDDSHKDFFRIYDTAWESFRAHSQLLNAKRYRRLFKLQPSDYKGWANGLQKAGYATDPKYAQKLIHIIEELNLGQYDF